jgi:transglutaminase-like putative cysteine protease
MKLSIHHQISLVLPAGTGRAVQHLLLTPQSGPMQTVRAWTMELPEGAQQVAITDAFGNRAHLVSEAKPAETIAITVSGIVETHDRNGVLGRIAGEAVAGLFLRQTVLTAPNSELVAEFTGTPVGKDRIGLLHALMARTAEVLKPARQSQSQGGQSQKQSGGRRAVAPTDLAHLFIGTARALGIPARFISGYLAKEGTVPPALHAWAEAFDDGLGWIAFDPKLQLCPTERHVRVACGLDALSAAAVRSVPTFASGAPGALKVELAAAQ